MTMLGWVGAAAIGLSLGLMGSGGSILTVPVLTFVIGQDEKLAIAGSLAIVGGISLAGAIPYAVRGRVDWPSLVSFGLPGMAGAYAGALLSRYVSGGVQLLVFAGVMLAAAVFMFRGPVVRSDESSGRQPIGLIAVEGFVVGVVTGLVGVGGGFLIVPALVLLAGLPMHQAIGTSLMIIAMKSFVGFYKYHDIMREADRSLDWEVILAFILVGMAASFLGGRISSRIDQATLKKAFALFLVVMGIFIVWRTLPGVLPA